MICKTKQQIMAANLVKFNAAEIELISAVAKRTAVQNPKNSTVDVDFKDADYMQPVFEFYKYENGEVAVRREVFDTAFGTLHYKMMRELPISLKREVLHEDITAWLNEHNMTFDDFKRTTTLIGDKFNKKRTGGKSWKFQNLEMALNYFSEYLKRARLKLLAR